MRRTSTKAIVCMGALLGAACMDMDEPATSTTSSELDSRIIYESTGDGYVEPYTAATVERAMSLARTVGASGGFEQCVANTMSHSYMNCADPVGTSRAREIEEAWYRFTTRNNTIRFAEYLNPDWVASAPQGQASNTYGTHTIYVSYPYTRTEDWNGPSQKWGWLAAVLTHEYVHTLGYRHVDDEAARATCAAANGRASYYELGEPAAPNIYGLCANYMMYWSPLQCVSEVPCPVGERYLHGTWDGLWDATQTSPHACECVHDPRYVIALRTSSGRMVTATSGGGSTLRTDTTTGIGAWQWFTVYDESRPRWASNDLVFLKTFNGNTLRRLTDGSFYADRTTPAPVQFELVAGAQLGNGARVRIKQLGQYAYDDGTTLRSSTTPTDSRFEFTIIEPRARDHLVYLRSAHGSYVNATYPGTRWAWNKRTTSELLNGTHAQKAAAAFWIVDWNGGQLMDGDQVSLEQFEGDSYHYLSVRDGDHTGQLRMNNEASTYEKFTIDRLDVTSGPITDNSEIALRSANGNYVTAMPADYFDGQLRNYATGIGAWQRFGFRFVSQFDQARPLWRE